jgi:hypothetical protein
MTNDAEAQEIQGTVVSTGRFPAADDSLEPAEVTDPADESTPEDQEDQEEERPGATDPGYEHAAVDREDGDGEDDEDEDNDDEDEDVDPDAVIIAEVDEVPSDDEAPSPVAGFARTPVASPVHAADDESEADTGISEADTSTEDAQTAAAVDHDAAEAATIPEADVIAEAARPGVPQVAGLPRNRDVRPVSGTAGDPAQLHERWLEVQSSFVDDPRASVAAAADLVGEAVAALVSSLQERETGLRGEWERDGADTEDLRNTLRGYRGLLDQVAAS